MRFKNICLMASVLLSFCAVGELGAQGVFQKSFEFATRSTSALIETPNGYLSVYQSGKGVLDTAQDNGLVIVKTGRNGEIEWRKILPYNYDLNLVPTDIIQTLDGGYCIAGRQTNTQFGWTEIYGILLKTDSLGNLQWSKRYADGMEGQEVFNMWFTRIEEQVNGNLMLMGRGSSYCYLASVDSSGTLLWAKRYYPYTGWADLQKDHKGNLISAGNYGLLKIDSSGNLIWSKSYGQYIFGVDITEDDGYIMCGAFDKKLHIIKTDENGTVQWARYYTIENSIPFWNPQPIRQLKDGNYVVVGSIETCSECYPPWYMIIDSVGTVISAKSPTTMNALIYSPVATLDGGFAFTGGYRETPDIAAEAMLLKADSAGNLNCSEKVLTTFSQSFEPVVGDTPAVFEVRNMKMRDIVTDQIPLGKITVKDLCNTVGIHDDDNEASLILSPNPASQTVTVSLKELPLTADISIIDITGRTLYRTFLKDPGQKIRLDISPLLKGIYFVKVSADGREDTQKLLVE